MDELERKIRDTFPMEKFRPGQFDDIRRIAEAFRSHDFVAYEGATGVGKSVIGWTLGRMMNDSYTLTHQKMLQDQYADDFGAEGALIRKGVRPSAVLKGRSSYPCTVFGFAASMDESEHRGAFISRLAELPSVKGGRPIPRSILVNAERYLSEWCARTRLVRSSGGDPDYPDCDSGLCRSVGRSSLPVCVAPMESGSLFSCPYYTMRSHASSSRHSILNYHSFFFNLNMEDTPFSGRDLIVYDEAHHLDRIVSSLVGLTVRESWFKDHIAGFSLPKLDSVEAYLDWFDETGFEDALRELKYRASEACGSVMYGVRLERRCEAVLSWIRTANRREHMGNWIFEYKSEKRGPSVDFSPVMVGDYLNEFFYRHGRKHLFMSATLGSGELMKQSWGLGESDLCVIRRGSTFPRRNRPVFFANCGKMTRGNPRKIPWDKSPQAQSIGRQVEYISGWCGGNGRDKRAVIHAGSHAYCEKLLERFPSSVVRRIKYQKDFGNDRTAVLEAHAEDPRSIVLAPAMHEGTDFKGSLAAAQFLCKIPYPNFGDPKIVARCSMDRKYRDHLTVIAYKQMLGRIVRTPDDYGETYILDGDFGWWIRNMARTGLVSDEHFESIIFMENLPA